MRPISLAFIGILTAGLFLTSCSDNVAGSSNDGNALGGAKAEQHKIVFSAGLGTSTEIALMNSDGTGIQQLTRNNVSDINASVSPPGQEIVFQSTRNGQSGIYLVNIDGTSERVLSVDGSRPSWSPDGMKVAYASQASGNSDIWIVNADGTGQRQLTTSSAFDGTPFWSPDGRLIVFVSDRQQSDIDLVYVMNADGTGQRRISSTSHGYLIRSTPWSPDGRQIAYTGRIGSLNQDQIFVVNVDGTSLRQLTNFSGIGAGAPCWSPDGRSIIFGADVADEQNIHVMNSDGSSQRPLTTTGTSPADYAVWSPDGNTIAFTQDGAIMVINPDGTGLRRVSPATVQSDRFPLWSPVRIR